MPQHQAEQATPKAAATTADISSDDHSLSHYWFEYYPVSSKVPKKNDLSGAEESLMSNLLAVQSWGLEFDPRYPHKKPGAGASFCNPNSEKSQTEASRSSLASPTSQMGDIKIQ